MREMSSSFGFSKISKDYQNRIHFSNESTYNCFFLGGGDISQISLIKKLPNDISKQLTMIVLLKSEYTEQHSGVIFGQFIFTLVSAFPITILPLSLRQRHLPISAKGVSHHSDRLH